MVRIISEPLVCTAYTSKGKLVWAKQSSTVDIIDSLGNKVATAILATRNTKVSLLDFTSFVEIYISKGA